MIAWNDYAVGDHRTQCPACGQGGRAKNLGVTITDDGKGVAHCFKCNFTESYRRERGAHHIPTVQPIRQPHPQKHETLNEWARALWRECHPLSGVASMYLKARHCRIPPEDGHLRWHPALKHPSGHVGPALVALVTDIHTRQHLSLHRTWITPTGKADLETPRLPLANHSLKNGVIRLYPDDWVTNWLGLAEGIETALSMAHAYTPVWATIDAGHLSQFPVLVGVGELVIAQDQDPAGMSAASICARRWADAGRTVLVTDQKQNDLNDVLKEAA